MATAAARARTARTDQPAPRGEGRGRVLAAAFDEAERQPALTESRDQALELVARGAPPHEVAAVVEADVGLTCAVIRAAGQLQGGARIRSVPDAVERLGPGAVEAVLRAAPTYNIFNGDGRLALHPDRFRLHALLVQRCADRISETTGIGDRDELALASILHDIGRPVLARLHPGYAERFDRRGATPDDRIDAERRELGHRSCPCRRGAHPPLGSARADRRGGRAPSLEAGRGPCGGHPRFRHGRRPRRGLPGEHRGPARFGHDLAGSTRRAIRRVLFELPQGKGARRRASGPCPLSARELDVLRRLAEGKVYKQIAQELELSASTVRSHLHNVYGKLGALDRAQAVLMATEQGWI